jgi:hypothetical protein
VLLALPACCASGGGPAGARLVGASEQTHVAQRRRGALRVRGSIFATFAKAAHALRVHHAGRLLSALGVDAEVGSNAVSPWRRACDIW